VRIALIDYDAGNLHSAAKALMRALDETGQRGEVIIGADPDVIASADRIVLPGDGAFRDCREHLAAVPGLTEALEEAVRAKGRPFLGICVGMQLLAGRGLERGETAGLGWIPGDVVPLLPSDPAMKVPHMGWNTLEAVGKPHAVLEGIALGPQGLHAYFLHSYHLIPQGDANLIATAEYGGPVSAIVGRDTIIGTQFHPEKSQVLGVKLLANFLKWAP
jgi:glutamine amidotransferase